MDENLIYDVIIVGAGPGGATAAYFLSQAGKRVLVIEKENLPHLAHARAEVRQSLAVRNITELKDRVVVEMSDGNVVEGRYLIGADGASSVVARALGLRRGKTMAAAIEAEIRVSPDVRQQFGDALWFIFGDIHQGYAWVFPKSDHLWIGIAALHPKHGELLERR